MLAANETQELFDSKAHSWQSKYGPGGRLSHRPEQFVTRLSELCSPPARILDMGCGTGDIAATIGQVGYEITACDIAENMLKVARRGWMGVPVEWLLLKPTWKVLPFKDHLFDGVICSSVFEYLAHVEGAVRELARVLRPGGVLIFTVPNPCNRIRKIEARLRSGFLSHALPSWFRGIRSVKSYLTYLKLSRNRFAGVWWKSLLGGAGFEPVDGRDFSDENWLEQADAPLVLLAARKVAASRLHPF